MTESNISILLKISKPVNEAFLRIIFNANKVGPVKITRKNEVGKYIYSRVRTSNLPKKPKEGITILLPDSELFYAESYFLYFTAEDEKKINDFLDANFHLFFHLYMLQGTMFGIPFRRKIEALIAKMNMADYPTMFENFKKSDYRKRKDVTDFLFESLKLIDN